MNNNRYQDMVILVNLGEAFRNKARDLGIDAEINIRGMSGTQQSVALQPLPSPGKKMKVRLRKASRNKVVWEKAGGTADSAARMRARILAFIQASPGLTSRAIAKRMKIDSRVVGQNLRWLRVDGAIRIGEKGEIYSRADVEKKKKSSPASKPQAAAGAEKMLTAEEVAKFLTVSPRTLWGLTKSGELPAIKVKHRVFYRPADIEAFIDANRTTGPRNNDKKSS